MLHNNKQIYALCDYQTLLKFDISLKQFLDKIKSLNIIYIQYRDKLNNQTIQKQNLLLLKQYTNIPIIINDNLDLVQFCDGVHLGQEDIQKYMEKFSINDKELFFKFLSEKYPNKTIGISTHNEVEILEANELDIDYIGLGAYANTTTKDVSNILGDKISYLSKISKHKVGAIGGVKLTHNIPNIDYYVIGSDLLR